MMSFGRVQRLGSLVVFVRTMMLCVYMLQHLVSAFRVNGYGTLFAQQQGSRREDVRTELRNERL